MKPRNVQGEKVDVTEWLQKGREVGAEAGKDRGSDRSHGALQITVGCGPVH